MAADMGISKERSETECGEIARLYYLRHSSPSNLTRDMSRNMC